MAYKVEPELKLYIKEEVDNAKQHSIRIFSALAIFIAILTGFGIYGLATKHTNDLIKEGVLGGLIQRAQESADKSDIYRKEAENDSAIISKIKMKYEPELISINKLKESINNVTNELNKKGIARFQWSSAGRVPGMECVQILEVADPHTWSDNYLCFSR